MSQLRLCQRRAVNASMLSDGVLYSFEHAIVDEKLRLALRIGIGALGSILKACVFEQAHVFATMFVIEASGGGWARFDV